MTTVSTNRRKVAGILFAVALGVNVLMSGVFMLIAHPSEAHRAASKEHLLASADAARRTWSGEVVEQEDTENSPELQDVLLVGGLTLPVFLLVNLALVIVGYGFARKQITAGNIESMVSLALGGGMILASVVQSFILPLYLGAPLWTAGYSHLGGYFILLGVMLTTLIPVGVIVHILEHRYKKRRSFEIE